MKKNSVEDSERVRRRDRYALISENIDASSHKDSDLGKIFNGEKSSDELMVEETYKMKKEGLLD